jgi:hypothetical protein
MLVNVIMYTFAQVSRYLLSVVADLHSDVKHVCVREGPHDTGSDDVITLTLEAYLALHHLSLFIASIPRSDRPVRATLRGETLPVQLLQH